MLPEKYSTKTFLESCTFKSKWNQEFEQNEKTKTCKFTDTGEKKLLDSFIILHGIPEESKPTVPTFLPEIIFEIQNHRARLHTRTRALECATQKIESFVLATIDDKIGLTENVDTISKEKRLAVISVDDNLPSNYIMIENWAPTSQFLRQMANGKPFYRKGITRLFQWTQKKYQQMSGATNKQTSKQTRRSDPSLNHGQSEKIRATQLQSHP